MRRRSQTEPDSLRVQRELPCAHPSRVHTAAPDRESPKDRAPFLQSPAVKSNRLSRQFRQTTNARSAVAVQCSRQPCAADAATRQHRRAARAFRFAPVPAQSARRPAPKRAGNRIPKYRKPDCSFAKGQFYHLRSVPPASAGGSTAQVARCLLDPSAHADVLTSCCILCSSLAFGLYSSTSPTVKKGNQSMPTTTITVAYGDGIGPEIMEATLHVLKEAGAKLDIQRIEIGEKVYLSGNTSGIDPSAWDSLRNTKVFLKAPITTPQGGGYKSLNVTVRKTLGLYANVRPCVSYHPFIETKHPGMDLVIVRENEEDLYAGIEYRQTDQVMQGLKIISRPGSEKIVRYAFEFARRHNRKKVTCFTKEHIMKLTDGLFHKVFNEIAAEYSDIENEHWIVDIGAAKMADTPNAFDVIVMPNLYGDILSDVAAQIAGSVGLAGSANIGENIAMFEAIHGSAPRRAGQNLANPSGLLLGSIMMLVHIGQTNVAERVHNAWLRTIEDGVRTYDIDAE